jgi:uncharacterized protein YciI
MTVAANRLFTILWRPGPAWIAGRSVAEQKLNQHREYIASLAAQGLIVVAGPFLDTESGGMAVLRAAEMSEAHQIFTDDPAIREGLFVGEVRPLFVVFADPALSDRAPGIEATACSRENDAPLAPLDKPGAA